MLIKDTNNRRLWINKHDIISVYTDDNYNDYVVMRDGKTYKTISMVQIRLEIIGYAKWIVLATLYVGIMVVLSRVIVYLDKLK